MGIWGDIWDIWGYEEIKLAQKNFFFWSRWSFYPLRSWLLQSKQTSFISSSSFCWNLLLSFVNCNCNDCSHLSIISSWAFCWLKMRIWGGDEIDTESAESFHFANIRLKLFNKARPSYFPASLSKIPLESLCMALIVAYLSVTMFGLSENIFGEQINNQTLAQLIYYSCLAA